jgi:prepilin-type N-terminal cleavage/methylation domain-containing protein
MRVRRTRHAFTLVEILIVVVILGIIASIVIAVFNNNLKDAAEKALRDDLRNMRSQLELYMAQHGTYPGLAEFEHQMVLYTDTSGNSSATHSDVFKYGPYIIAMPVMPVGTNKGKTGVTSNASYTPDYAWGYDPISGKFQANLPDTDLDSEGVKYNTY